MMSHSHHDTYADNESGVYLETDDHFVTFYVSGNKLTVKTTAATVKEALDRAGIIINDSDIIEPSLDTAINMDNFFINIYRSHPAIVRDGIKEYYIMTASYDYKNIAASAGITLYDGDEMRQVPNTNFLEAGAATTYEIIRNGGHIVTIDEEIPFAERTIKDYNLAPGTREVRELGEKGTRRLTYEIFYENNEEKKRDLLSDEVVRNPVDRVIAVGVSEIERTPLTASRGVNIYTVHRNGQIIERKETYYDLNMAIVMRNAATMCGVAPTYTVREDGVKIDADGYVLVAADLS
ncbi:MAG: G5 domain-containing protein, partial [Muribaculaceae bacterium]|nr:G5 domain-containing protein [Muribaculaceae bacterium]